MKNQAYPYYKLPQISNLKQMVLRHELERPDEVAFQYVKKKEYYEKTFAQVKADIDRVGAKFYELGLQGKHIGIIGSNSYEWIITFLAATNGGMVAVPIAKEYSAAEACELLKRSDCSAVVYSISHSKFLEHEDFPKDMITMPTKEIAALIKESASDYPEKEAYQNAEIDEEKLAAIFFTSGTTGSSKGVMLSHKNMASNINFAVKNFVLEGNTLSVLPFNHSFGLVTAIFKAFHYGQATYLNKNLKHLKEDLAASKPQTLFLVPLFLETLYKQIWRTAEKGGKDKKLKFALNLCEKVGKVSPSMADKLRKKLLKEVLDVFGGRLEYVICGGARLDPFIVKEYRKFGIEVLNGYGITECSPVLSVNRNFHHVDGSVGLILPGIEAKIAYDNEIIVKGDCIFMGYYKDEASTAQVLKDGWYSTGDLGRIDKDGFLFITGRKKDLIILSNGENVSPEIMEEEIKHNPSVEEVVIFIEDNKLVCEIFPTEEHIGDFDHIKEVIHNFNKTQPAYRQIAKVYLRETEFEKNANKKLLRFKVTEAHQK